ncbi:MAG TPA: hypothetical protein VNL73_03225 [Verrucomicrobiae bacterium]|nr:hypothetical protein [Verrucomicrobiae bacterium]
MSRFHGVFLLREKKRLKNPPFPNDHNPNRRPLLVSDGGINRFGL